MSSEIRANTLKNRVGLGTVSFTNTGPVVSGIVTATSIEVVGALNNDAARIKIPDGMNGAPFTGNLEFGNNRDFVVLHDGHHNYIKANNGNVYITCGGNTLTTLLTSGTVLLNRDLDVDGHTNLDNVSIAGVTTFNNNVHANESIYLGNNDKIIFGNSGNSEIYSNDSHLYVTDNAAGYLHLQGNYGVVIQRHNGTENMIRALSNGAVELYHDNTKKFETTGAGVTVTNGDLRQQYGGISSKLGYISGGAEAYFGSTSNHSLVLGTNDTERLRITTSGAIGLNGTNYGSAGQVFTSQGSGSAPTWSTISGTTINNNADNRVITGSGTANTLNGESGVTIDGSNILAILGTGQQQLNVGSTNAGGAAIVLDGDSNGDGAGGDYSLIRHNTSGDLEFYARNGSGATNTIFKQGTTEKFRMGNDGNLTISDGDLVIASGPHGIDFSADSSGTLQTLAGSLNAELLHDYEVGTFTPNIQYDTGTNQYYGSPGSGHYVASSKGEYIRIGDMMYAAGQITLTGNRNSTQTVHISIGGMPYNGLHSSQQNSLMTGWGGAAWPKNDSNSSFRLYYSYHNYTTLNFAFKQTAGNNGIDGFNFHVYYRCTT